MAYRDEFYVAANIIAYTGDINDHPTVYFALATLNGTAFGRITQAHGNADNIGREKLRVHADYRLENCEIARPRHAGQPAGPLQLTCVEHYAGRIQHVSRNPAVFRPAFALRDLALLTQAIALFPQAKTMYQ